MNIKEIANQIQVMIILLYDYNTYGQWVREMYADYWQAPMSLVISGA